MFQRGIKRILSFLVVISMIVISVNFSYANEPTSTPAPVAPITLSTKVLANGAYAANVQLNVSNFDTTVIEEYGIEYSDNSSENRRYTRSDSFLVSSFSESSKDCTLMYSSSEPTIYYRPFVEVTIDGVTSKITGEVKHITKLDTKPTEINIEADAGVNIVAITGTITGLNWFGDGTTHLGWSKNADFSGSSWCDITPENNGQIKYLIDRLEPETTYYVRCELMNADSVISASTVTFTTTKDSVITLDQIDDSVLYNDLLKKYGTDNALKLSKLERVDSYDIDFRNIGITNLKGLTYLKNLRRIYIIGSQQIRSIECLKCMPMLSKIIISDSYIKDISYLSQFKCIKELTIKNSRVEDASVISGLTQLTDLDLSNNQLKTLPDFHLLTLLNPNLTEDGYTQLFANFEGNFIPSSGFDDAKLPVTLTANNDWKNAQIKAQKVYVQPMLIVANIYYATGTKQPFFMDYNNITAGYYTVTVENIESGASITKEESTTLDFLRINFDNINTIVTVPSTANLKIKIVDKYDNSISYESTHTVKFEKDIPAIQRIMLAKPGSSKLDISFSIGSRVSTADFESIVVKDALGNIYATSTKSDLNTYAYPYARDDRYQQYGFSQLSLPSCDILSNVYTSATVSKTMSEGVYDIFVTYKDVEYKLDNALTITSSGVIYDLAYNLSDYPHLVANSEYMYVEISGTNFDPTKVYPVIEYNSQVITDVVNYKYSYCYDDKYSVVYKLKRIDSVSQWYDDQMLDVKKSQDYNCVIDCDSMKTYIDNSPQEYFSYYDDVTNSFICYTQNYEYSTSTPTAKLYSQDTLLATTQATIIDGKITAHFVNTDGSDYDVKANTYYTIYIELGNAGQTAFSLYAFPPSEIDVSSDVFLIVKNQSAYGIYSPDKVFPVIVEFYKPYDTILLKSIQINQNKNFTADDLSGLSLNNELYSIVVKDQKGIVKKVYNRYKVSIETNVSVTGVTLDKTNVSLSETTQTQLTAIVSPMDATNKTLIWESANTGIATVSNTGVVTGIAAGTTDITVKTKDGNFTAKCTVTVTSNALMAITLSHATISLTVNNTQTLKATSVPANATNSDKIQWKTSNTSVATVSSTGVVTAKSAGTATITAYILLFDQTLIKADCLITVTTTQSGDTGSVNPGGGTSGGTPSGGTSGGGTSGGAPSSGTSGSGISGGAPSGGTSGSGISGGTSSGGTSGEAQNDPISSTTAANKKQLDKSGSVKWNPSDMAALGVLEIQGEINIRFDQKALENMKNQTEVTLVAKKVDATTLSDKAKTLVGDRPAFDINLSGGNQTITNLSEGQVTIEIPYILKPNEDPNAIVVYYINSEGKLKVVNCDHENGVVRFKTNHFSTYVVGYNLVSFTDVSGWYENNVTYLASRNVINGNNGQFQPQKQITRAEFVQILANMANMDASKYTQSSLSDVKTTNWYFAAVEWAYKNEIAKGWNGTFSPNAPITREDMAVMLQKFLDSAMKFSLPATTTAANFADANSVATYAKDAVQLMQEGGIINGKSGNLFDPKGNATRAEATTMIALILKAYIK